MDTLVVLYFFLTNLQLLYSQDANKCDFCCSSLTPPSPPQKKNQPKKHDKISILYCDRWRVLDYFTMRVKANLQIIDQVDLIGRTSEFARVFGIEFYHVLSRGSQVCVVVMFIVSPHILFVNFSGFKLEGNQRIYQHKQIECNIEWPNLLCQLSCTSL